MRKVIFSRFSKVIVLSAFILSCLPIRISYAATVPSGIMFPWPSTNASIPSGYSRETQLDGLYIQGAATGADADLSTSRGATTHTHVSPSITITQNVHTHTISAGASSGYIIGDGFVTIPASDGHTHNSSTSAVATATNQSATPTVSANTSNDLPYIDVIWIKSDGTPTGVPSNAYGFFASDTLPTSWTRVQGDTYLRGAAASGNGGGTGGSLTHTHPGSVQPTQNSHPHAAANSAAASGSGDIDTTTGTNTSKKGHTHSVSLSSATATNQNDSRTSTATNHEPLFKKLNIINNGTGGSDYPTSIIGIWGGTVANIPSDYTRFTSMDGYFQKGANADGESNVTTGGSQTHQHDLTFQPTQDSHYHNSSVSGGAQLQSVGCLNCLEKSAASGHTHTWTIGSTVVTNQSTSVTVNANTSEDAYPPYRRVIFVQYNPTAGRRRVHVISWILFDEFVKKEKEMAA